MISPQFLFFLASWEDGEKPIWSLPSGLAEESQLPSKISERFLSNQASTLIGDCASDKRHLKEAESALGFGLYTHQGAIQDTNSVPGLLVTLPQ